MEQTLSPEDEKMIKIINEINELRKSIGKLQHEKLDFQPSGREGIPPSGGVALTEDEIQSLEKVIFDLNMESTKGESSPLDFKENSSSDNSLHVSLEGPAFDPMSFLLQPEKGKNEIRIYLDQKNLKISLTNGIEIQIPLHQSQRKNLTAA